MLLPEIQSCEDAVQVAEKVLARSAEPYWVKTREMNIVLSIGIAIFPDDGNDAESLLRARISRYIELKPRASGKAKLVLRPRFADD